MKIVAYKMHQFNLKLNNTYRFADVVYNHRPINVVVLQDELGNVGFGEVEAFEFPNYIDETQAQAVHILKTRILPLLGSKDYDTPFEFSRFIDSMSGPYMGRAAAEMAIWDLFAKRNNCSVQDLMSLAIGLKERPQNKVSVGVAIGIKRTSQELIHAIDKQLQAGYTRIKLKINRSYTVKMLTDIRRQFPDQLMMIDCNSQFGLKDSSFFQNIDGLNFAMIEQPFSKKDFRDHAKLQQRINTPICLDENIFNSDDIWKMINQGSGRFVNMKLARVGGISNALAISTLAVNHGLKVWCGGMLETGVGRAFNLALASMPMFTFPGDISASDRYYQNDITSEKFEMIDGKIAVPQSIGLGVTLNQSTQAAFDQEEWVKLI